MEGILKSLGLHDQIPAFTAAKLDVGRFQALCAASLDHLIVQDTGLSPEQVEQIYGKLQRNSNMQQAYVAKQMHQPAQLAAHQSQQRFAQRMAPGAGSNMQRNRIDAMSHMSGQQSQASQFTTKYGRNNRMAKLMHGGAGQMPMPSARAAPLLASTSTLKQMPSRPPHAAYYGSAQVQQQPMTQNSQTHSPIASGMTSECRKPSFDGTRNATMQPVHQVVREFTQDVAMHAQQQQQTINESNLLETKREESTILEDGLAVNQKENSPQELHVNVSAGHQEAGQDTEIDMEDEADSVIDDEVAIVKEKSDHEEAQFDDMKLIKGHEQHHQANNNVLVQQENVDESSLNSHDHGQMDGSYGDEENEEQDDDEEDEDLVPIDHHGNQIHLVSNLSTALNNKMQDHNQDDEDSNFAVPQVIDQSRMQQNLEDQMIAEERFEQQQRKDIECTEENDISDPDADDQSLSSESQPMKQQNVRPEPIVVPQSQQQIHHSRPTQGMKEPVGNNYNNYYRADAGQDMQDEDSQDFDDGESNDQPKQQAQRLDHGKVDQQSEGSYSDEESGSQQSQDQEESNALPSDSEYLQKTEQLKFERNNMASVDQQYYKAHQKTLSHVSQALDQTASIQQQMVQTQQKLDHVTSMLQKSSSDPSAAMLNEHRRQNASHTSNETFLDYNNNQQPMMMQQKIEKPVQLPQHQSISTSQVGSSNVHNELGGEEVHHRMLVDTEINQQQASFKKASDVQCNMIDENLIRENVTQELTSKYQAQIRMIREEAVKQQEMAVEQEKENAQQRLTQAYDIHRQEIESKTMELRGKIMCVQNDLEKKRLECEDYANRVRQMGNLANVQQQTMEMLESTKMQLRKESEDRSRLQEEKNRKESQLQEILQREENWRAEKESLSLQIEAKESHIRSVQEHLRQTTADLQDETAKTQKYEAMSKTLQSELADLKAEHAGVVESLNVAKAQTSQQAEQISQLKNQISERETTHNTEMARAQAELQEERLRSQQMLAKKHAELEEMRQTIDQLEQEVEAVKAENERLRSEQAQQASQMDQLQQQEVVAIEPSSMPEDDLEEDARKLDELKKQLNEIQAKAQLSVPSQPMRTQEIVLDEDSEPISAQVPNQLHHSQLSLNALSQQSKGAPGREESSYLPEFVPAPPKAEKKIIKKVRFHDDDHIASGEKRRTRQEASPKFVPLRRENREEVQPVAGRKRMRPIIDDDEIEELFEEKQVPQKQRRLKVKKDFALEMPVTSEIECEPQSMNGKKLVSRADHVQSNGSSAGQATVKASNKLAGISTTATTPARSTSSSTKKTNGSNQSYDQKMKDHMATVDKNLLKANPTLAAMMDLMLKK